MKKAALMAVAVMAWAPMALAHGKAQRGDEQAKSEIQASVDRFASAWNRHDAKEMATVVTDDGVLINPFGRKATGRAEVEKLFQDEQSGPMKGSRFEAKVTQVRTLAPGVVFADADITIQNMMGADGTPVPVSSHHLSAVFTRKGDRWQAMELRAWEAAKAPEAGVGGAGSEQQMHHHMQQDQMPMPQQPVR